MEIDPKMVDKGSKVPLTGLRDQASVSRELLRQHEAELGQRGWNERLTTEYDELQGIVEDSRADQLEAAAAKRSATKAEREAVARAKQFKRVLLEAVVDLATDGLLPLPRSSFAAGSTLRRNTARISSYLADIRPHVEAAAGTLLPRAERTGGADGDHGGAGAGPDPRGASCLWRPRSCTTPRGCCSR